MLNYTIHKHKTATEWVTFVHGAGGSSSIWFKQVRSFSAQFNVLILDLRGHGDAQSIVRYASNEKYTFDAITCDIVEVIDHLKIKMSHFVGVSLGTILIRNLAEKNPARVQSMIMVGAIMKFDFRSQVLIKLGAIFKSIIPYMLLYKLFAFIIMPRENHKDSRLIFVNEAKKMYQKEFVRWFNLTAGINTLLRFFRVNDIKIPTLYIMGEEDYLFLPSIRKMVAEHSESTLFVIEKCGHVANVEQAEIFNVKTIQFINALGR